MTPTTSRVLQEPNHLPEACWSTCAWPALSQHAPTTPPKEGPPCIPHECCSLSNWMLHRTSPVGEPTRGSLGHSAHWGHAHHQHRQDATISHTCMAGCPTPVAAQAKAYVPAWTVLPTAESTDHPAGFVCCAAPAAAAPVSVRPSAPQ